MSKIRQSREEVRPDPLALIRISEASRLRRIPSRRIREALRRGELRGIWIGAWTRVRLGDLDAWIDCHAVEGRSALTGETER